MIYVNLTPHDVVIRDHDDLTMTYPASGTIARVFEAIESEPSPDEHRRVVVTSAISRDSRLLATAWC